MLKIETILEGIFGNLGPKWIILSLHDNNDDKMIVIVVSFTTII
jgi:hypothetical protein